MMIRIRSYHRPIRYPRIVSYLENNRILRCRCLPSRTSTTGGSGVGAGNRQKDRHRNARNRDGAKNIGAFVSFFDEVDAKMEQSRIPTVGDFHGAKGDKEELPMPKTNGLASLLQTDSGSNTANSINKTNTSSNGHSNTPLRSIFDLFPEPSSSDSQPPPEESNAIQRYDSVFWQEYESILRKHVIENPRFSERLRKKRKGMSEKDFNPVYDWLLNNERFVVDAESSPEDNHNHNHQEHEMEDAPCNNDISTFLLNQSHSTIPTQPLSTSANTQPETSSSKPQQTPLRSLLQNRRQTFLQDHSFTPRQHNVAYRAFTALANYCAGHGRYRPLVIAWEKMKESGMVVGPDVLHTFLYVAGSSVGGRGFLTSGVSSGVMMEGVGGGPKIGNKKNDAVDDLMTVLGGGGTRDTDPTHIYDDDFDENHRYIREDEDRNGKMKTGSEMGVITKTGSGIDFPSEIAVYHDLLYEATEKSINMRVRHLVSRGDAVGAETLLDTFPSGDGARLRNYIPILKLYCEKGDVDSAFTLFHRMRDEPRINLEAENYVLLLSTLAERRYFGSSSPNTVTSARSLGYSHSSGPQLFHDLVKLMSDDVLEISSASVRRLYNALIKGFQPNTDNCSNDDDDNIVSTDTQTTARKRQRLESIHSLADLSPTTVACNNPDELIADRVTVEKSTGVCPVTGVKLRLIKLDWVQKEKLRSRLLELSHDTFEEFAKNNKYNDIGGNGDAHLNNAKEELDSFIRWLDTREGEPYTAIVDGANVAYYMQNFNDGSFNYHQIQFMVDALEKMNEKPLVVVPYKYCLPSFHLMMGGTSRWQTLSQDEQKIMFNLKNTGRLYQVPSRCLDDYYWILASVSNQTVSRGGRDLDVPPSSKRWPGTRPIVVSNDQMRDHQLGLLEPRLFRRWTSCHVVNYGFTAFVGDRSTTQREMVFSTADFFSREIQGNEGRDGGGMVWHFPVKDWGANDRFCVRIPC